jgi:hypothetical protein
MGFTPADGISNSTTFPDAPGSSAAARLQIQTLLDQIADYINQTLLYDMTKGDYNYDECVSGTDAYSVQLTKVDALDTGLEVLFKADVANTGAATLGVNVLAAKPIRKNGTTVLEDGDIPAGGIAHVKYDGTYFQLLNPQAITKSIFTAAGDMLYATAAGTPARLAKGTALQALQMNAAATAPEWAASAQSVLTAGGDLLYASTANTLARLAKGTAYQSLGMNAAATAPAWMASLQSLMTAAGDIVYASSANTPARLAKGTAYQLLRMKSDASNVEWGSDNALDTHLSDKAAAGSLGHIRIGTGLSVDVSGIVTAGGYSVVTSSHDISITGAQSITGAGFTPRAVICIAVVSTTSLMSAGFSDGTTHACVTDIHAWTADSWSPTSDLIYLVYAGGVQARATAAFTSDGCNLTWTKDSTPTGTATLKFIFLK